jgi:selenocysteine lyase/cysteine desulfurase
VTTPIADPLDLPSWRADTPGCEHRAHFNNAGAALMPNAVIAATHEHIDLEARIGGYEAAAARASAVAEVYQSLAMLVGAAPQNVAITTSATTAFLQTLAAIDVAPGDAIVTSVSDYTSYQIQLLALARKSGVRILRAEDLPEGGVDPDNVRFLLRTHRCRLVTLSWMPTHSGLIQRAEDVGGVCEEFDVPYHVDACQVVGQLPIDLAALRCDYLSATGRKYLRGPRGTGFLIVSDRALARGDYPRTIDMRGAEWISENEFRVHSTARRFEEWEFAYALVLGLGAAAQYALAEGVDATAARAIALASQMREALAAIPGIRVLDMGSRRGAIVTFSHATVAAAEIVKRLAERRINTVVSERWYGLLDFTRRNVTAAVRASPHYYNSAAELETFSEAVAWACTEGR